MRFNPKARLDTSRVGDAGRGSRAGGGGGGIPIPGGVAGGGIGTLIIIVIVVVANMALGGGGSGDGGGQATDTGRYEGQCTNGQDANESADCARVAIENSLTDY